MIRDGINRDLMECAQHILTKSADEKKKLLLEAAGIVERASRLLAPPGTETEVSNFAIRLADYAYGIEFRYADETADVLLEAAGMIRRLRIMLGLQQEQL